MRRGRAVGYLANSLDPGNEILEWLVVLAATLPAIAAFFSLSRELRAYEPHAHAYGLMDQMFSRAAEEAKKPTYDDAEFSGHRA